MYNGKYFTYFGLDVEHPLHNPVYSIEFDSHDNLWFGTATHGVVMFDGKLLTQFTEKDGFINNIYIRSVLEDSHGNLWFSTQDAGVSKYDGQRFTNYTEKEGLSDNYVRCIFEDSHGNLWLGTENSGANIISDDSITYFTEKEGLCSNSVRSMLEDNNGNIWIGTSNGLNCLVPGSESIIYSLNEQDGLQDMDFNNNAVVLDSKNRLWWGTARCLTMMDLNDFNLPAEAPSHIQLNRIDINGQFLDYRRLEEKHRQENTIQQCG